MASSESNTSLFSRFSRYSNLSSSLNSSEDPYYYNPEPNLFGVITGFICLIVGLIYVFLGKRFIRFCTAFTGCIVFGCASLIAIILTSNLHHSSTITLTLIPLIVGVICAYIFGYFVKIGICLIGFCVGAKIWLIIFSFVKSDSLGLYIGIAIFGIAGAILINFKMDKMVIVGTAFLGSQIFISWISYLTSIGYFVIFDFGQVFYYSSKGFWGTFIGSIFLAGIGMIYQFAKFSEYQYLYIPKKSTQSPV